VWTAAGNSSTVGRPGTRLYCFGTDIDDEMAFVPSKGRNAFLSSFLFDLSTGFDIGGGTFVKGLDGANALCQAQARGRSLSGTYRALLATTTRAAIDFFEVGPETRPWVRLDGVPLAATAQDFANGDFLTALDLLQDGTGYYAYRTWTGADSLSSVGTDTCTDWTDSANPNQTRVGHSVATESGFFNYQLSSCNPVNNPNHLYCLEE
jgi:hypothetical protein